MTVLAGKTIQSAPKQTCVKYLCKPLDKFNKVRYNIATTKTYDEIKINSKTTSITKGRPATPPQPKLQAKRLRNIEKDYPFTRKPKGQILWTRNQCTA